MRALAKGLAAWMLLTQAAVADTGVITAESDDTDPAEETDDTDEFYPTGGRTVQCGTLPAPAGAAVLALLALGAAGRRRSLRGLSALLLALAALGGAPAQAQDLTPSLDVQRFDPAGLAGGFATITTARQLEQKTFSFEVTGTYAWRPLQRSIRVADTLIRESAAIEHLGAAHVRVAVGATDWFQIALSMPVIQGMQFGTGLDSFGGPRSTPAGVGDLTLDLAFRPLAEEKGVGIAIIPFVIAPTGSRAYLLTDGTVAFGGRVAISGQAAFVHLAAYGGYKVKLGSATLSPFYAIDDEVLYGAGIGFDLYQRILRLNLELSGTTIVGPGLATIRPTAVTAELHTGLEANANLAITTPSGFALVVGGGTGITASPGVPAARAFLGLGYVPFRDQDRDDDGIMDRLDDCPKEPEDFDTFEDEDGCPETDNDGDGVPDADDRCPDAAEDFDGVEDEDGCPDADNDGDGVSDESDACPDVPEDPDGFEDEDGCPETDNDGDGVLDVADACPDVAEDKDGIADEDGCPEEETDTDGDGVPDSRDACPQLAEDLDNFQDDDGCPEPDNDGDGLLDTVDTCPNAAEDFDGVQDTDGCPEDSVDTDGDGIPDGIDKCPRVAEVINGLDDTDGCPDEGKVRLTSERIEILETILFFTAEARIRPESFGVLDAVRDVLASNTEIQRIRVEGHTDSQGGNTYNQDLSERRALAVRDYLIAAGVSPTRLLARGFGEDYPVAPNSAEAGRQQNRRVEFVILQPTDPAY